MEVAVVVLGDVGRSPRMQYHAKSIADLATPQMQTRVSLVGYRGEPCVPEVQEHPRIRQYLFDPYTTNLPRKALVLYAPVKVAVLVWRLAFTLLFRIPRPDIILVQNPPSIPALAIVWLTARIYGARMVVDWHNFGFTVLAQSKGDSHPFVRLSRHYERFFAGCADAHFSVTRAMQKWIKANWGVEPVVLYDKAPHFFHKTDEGERHALFSKLESQLRTAQAAFEKAKGLDGKGSDGSTLFTCLANGKAKLRPDRPALVVSSTSWTEDEDFGLLLSAIELLDERVQSDAEFPFVVFVVTGKGPLKQMYEGKMAKLVLKKMHVCTMWLEPQDYPLLLGSADLGVCLHTSTSGLDLPMKVVDMFGCSLPVCAVGFDCLDELVRHGENGTVFGTGHELAEQLQELLCGCTRPGGGNKRLEQLRQGVADFERWDPNWQRNARPVFRPRSDKDPAPASLAGCGLLVVLAAAVLLIVAVSLIVQRIWIVAPKRREYGLGSHAELQRGRKSCLRFRRERNAED